MQTRTDPQTASPMEELDEAHQLEIQILNLKNLGYTMVRGYMERYWDHEPVFFGAGHRHCLFENSPAHQVWHNDARVNKKASDMTPPIYIRLTFLIEDVEEDMGPTALLPGTHGTHVNSPSWFTAPDGQPRQVPEMVLASGRAGDYLINDTSIFHTNTPNLSDRERKVIWALDAGAQTPIWVRKDLPEDYRDQARLTKADVGATDDPVMAALFRNLPED